MRRSATRKSRARTREDHIKLRIHGHAIPLRVRRHPRARQLILRIDAETDGAVLTLPSRVPLREGLELAHSKADWILEQLATLPPRIPFAPGARIPFRGAEHRIRHAGRSGSPVRYGDGVIRVAGQPEHLERRLKDWLRRQARRVISARAQAKCEAAGRHLHRIVLRDTRSRWGSCAADGTLSFSWRLIMTPDHVLDYVVAHEVAHLVHRNHGPRFWALVDTLTTRATQSRAWLGAHGPRLRRYG